MNTLHFALQNTSFDMPRETYLLAGHRGDGVLHGRARDAQAAEELYDSAPAIVQGVRGPVPVRLDSADLPRSRANRAWFLAR